MIIPFSCKGSGSKPQDARGKRDSGTPLRVGAPRAAAAGTEGAGRGHLALCSRAAEGPGSPAGRRAREPGRSPSWGAALSLAAAGGVSACVAEGVPHPAPPTSNRRRSPGSGLSRGGRGLPKSVPVAQGCGPSAREPKTPGPWRREHRAHRHAPPPLFKSDLFIFYFQRSENNIRNLAAL